jgi:MFS family permease
VNALGLLGAAIGFLSSGGIMQGGRRRAGLIANGIIFVASALYMHLSLTTLCVGRVLAGIGAGLSGAVMSKSIAENIPGVLATKYGMAFNIFVGAGLTICFILGFLIPTDEESL